MCPRIILPVRHTRRIQYGCMGGVGRGALGLSSLPAALFMFVMQVACGGDGAMPSDYGTVLEFLGLRPPRLSPRNSYRVP